MRKMIDAGLELRLQEYEPQQPEYTVREPVWIAFDAELLRQAAQSQPAAVRNAKRYRH